ncbi:MAG TPA: hypothetical protein DEA46_01570 [Candidatus Moranbacteria bacterium]|nr:hypothetical protein [Candidatus Moranbacteria bacterium]
MGGGFESPLGEQQEPVIKKIERSDISREMPGEGETEIIMQRHEAYIRDVEDERAGSLKEEEAKKSYDLAVEVFGSKLENLSEDERSTVDVLVIASNTQYVKGRRSFETAAQALKGAEDVFKKYGIDEKQILNSGAKREGEENRPTKNTAILEPQFIDQSPEFREFLKEKYGDGAMTQKFWQAFEEDWEKEEREKVGAEGPDDILERYTKFMNVLAKFSEVYHKKHSGRRLIIWPVSHYDTISPFVKKMVGMDTKKDYLAVDYGAGISLKIDKSGKMTSKIKGQEFTIEKK